MVDDMAIIKTVNTEAINHDPAITYIQTGAQLPGRPSLGAWLSYGLGESNRRLAQLSSCCIRTWSAKRDAQALYARLWGTGFLPSRYQGVSLRSQGDPGACICRIRPASSPQSRRNMLDALAKLNRKTIRRGRRSGDQRPHRAVRNGLPDADVGARTDRHLRRNRRHTLDMYGPDVHKPGTFAANCLLARRLAERNVRFVQVFIRGWDQHGNLPNDIRSQCGDVDQGSAALVKDLKQRGMLDDTLVIWGGEFGRTVYCQGTLTKTNYGRDHHPRCFTVWMAGGGVKPGIVYGETDDSATTSSKTRSTSTT